MFITSKVVCGSYTWHGGGYSRLGLPLASYILDRDHYQLVWDAQKKIPLYVYEQLTKNSISGSAKRKGHKFREDKEIPAPHRSKPSDYSGSGFDKGHHCPAANSKKSFKAMSHSFFLSNVSPQNPDLNTKQWADLEQEIRNLALKYSLVETYTGGAFIPVKCRDGKYRVIFEVIGENQVAVPTHFYKTILLHRNGTIKKRAYLIPNKKIPESETFKNFECAIEKIERVTGVIFRSLAQTSQAPPAEN